MTLLSEVLPDVLLHRLCCDFLTPPDVYSLAVANPDDPEKYKRLLVQSLTTGLDSTLRRSSVNFKSSDPLDSFIDMAKRLPRGSIAIR